MTIDQTMALLAVGVGGGIAGTMASVASVVSYPALLALGLPPLAANVTNTMSLVFCVPGAMLGSRSELSGGRLAVLFGVAVYLGYFGAAGGVLLLAALAATLSESLIRVNAIKNVVAGAANLVAALLFALYAPVDWAFVPPLAAGFLIGGYAGPRLARHLPAAALRVVVALAGLALAVKLGASAYR